MNIPLMQKSFRYPGALSLLLSLALLGSAAIALVHSYGGHEGGKDEEGCAICAFACHVAAAFLFTAFFAGLPLVFRLEPSRAGRGDLQRRFSPYSIRAPPCCHP